MGVMSISWDWKMPWRFAENAAKAEESSVEEFRAPPPDCEVRVHVCGDPAEALYVEMVLEQETIAYRRENTGTGPYGFTFVPQLGFCTLVVKKEDAKRAMSVISQALRDQGRHG